MIAHPHLDGYVSEERSKFLRPRLIYVVVLDFYPLCANLHSRTLFLHSARRCDEFVRKLGRAVISYSLLCSW